jgi:hypothetical protein
MIKTGRKKIDERYKFVQKGVSLSKYQWEQLGQNASYQIRNALEAAGIKIEKVNISS